jgi:peptidylprolyl isomerase
MTTAKEGTTVRVHYTGRLKDGSVFDSSEGRDPIEFTIGGRQVIPGFENMVLGMSVGAKKTTTIPAAEAYGERRDELVFEVDRQRLPPETEPAIGQVLEVQTADGQRGQVTVVAVADETVKLDANHALAGEDLTFEVELVSAQA